MDTSTNDKPSEAQMAQALEWFRNAMNYLRTETYVHLTKAYIDAIEEALSSYQAPSVRTVSRDAVAGPSEPVAIHMEPIALLRRVIDEMHAGQYMTKEERDSSDYEMLIDAWRQDLINVSKNYTHPATPPSPELEQLRAALAHQIRRYEYDVQPMGTAEYFIYEHGQTILAELERAG